jgi:hypothetical protein
MNIKMTAGLILCIGLVVLTAGCTSLYPASSDTKSNSQDVWTSETRIVSTGSVVPAPMATRTPSAPGSFAVAVIDTKIIKTASLNLEVKDVPGSVELLKTIATEKGGYLSSTNMQKGSEGQLSATVVIRIPAAQFDSALTGAKALGTVKSVSTQGQDVTEEYVDLVAQKTSYQNQLAQYNEIMKKCVNVEDILNVQEQIDQVQTQLNRLDGRLKYLDNRVDMSTITVNMHEPEPVGGDSGHNFIATINEGIAGFLGMIDVLIILVMTLFPLIIIGGIGYGIYRWRKGKKPAEAPLKPDEPAEKK